MKPFSLIAAAVAIIGAANIPAVAQKGKAAPAKPAAARDWTKNVVATPEGGFRMGNPNAPVKLVEYGSLTCPTCARFSAEGTAPLMERVKSGKLSFELRNFVLNGADLAAAVLSRCGGASTYFRLTEHYFANQSEWVGRLQSLPQDQAAKIGAMPAQQQLASLASAAGLEAMAVKNGLPATRAKQCLADPKAVAQLVAMNRTASEKGVRGTPTFFINGKQVAHAHDWKELEPLLRLPGG